MILHLTSNILARLGGEPNVLVKFRKGYFFLKGKIFFATTSVYI